jgi:hypothetical protein
MEKHRGQTQEEYDIFLTNGESIAIVEVKYKAHLEDINKLYGAMASIHFNKDTKDELLKQGYFIVERSGDLIHTENSDYLKVA